ncbi:MAG: hypothetical protein K2X91_06710 [Thermoleophilia bacterium]|nr:hypothetical protein [Thermoleophilia bacterium]
MRAPRQESAPAPEQNRNRGLTPALLMLLLVAAPALGACSSWGGRAPPDCQGTMRQLNPDRWQATPNDLIEPPPPLRGGRVACLPATPSAAVATAAAAPALAGGSAAS